MSKVRFGVDDLAGLQFHPGLGPVTESIIAWQTCAGTTGRPEGDWLDRLCSGRPALVARAASLAARYPGLPDLLTAITGGSAMPGFYADRDPELNTLLSEVRRIGISPIWPLVNRHIRTVIDFSAWKFVNGGVDQMFRFLHTDLRWEPPVLHVPDDLELTLTLGGSGLLLVPSFFHGNKCTLFGYDTALDQPCLMFPATATLRPVADSAGGNDQRLADLIGATRAAVLHALTDPLTTGELATALEISPASASKHATVLRQAGLITTTRRRNTALHSLTSLGSSLLHKMPAADSAPDMTESERHENGSKSIRRSGRGLSCPYQPGGSALALADLC